jgi:hypothetical protein
MAERLPYGILRRQVRIMATSGQKRRAAIPGILTALGFVVVVLLVYGISESVAAPSTGEAPEQARSAAIHLFQAEYGPVTEVYGQASTTRGAWARSEPSNTSGLVVSAGNSDEPVHAVFVRGSFMVEGPVMLKSGTPKPVTHRYVAGRIIFDDTGEILLSQVWASERPSDPAFGPSLDA